VGGSQAGIETNELEFITPSVTLGGVWYVTEGFSAKLSFALASRAPAINELLTDGVSQGLAAYEEGNVDLGPERTYSTTLDLNYKNTWLNVALTGYVQYIDDFIYLSPQLNADGEPLPRLTINGGFPWFEYSAINAIFTGFDSDIVVSPWPWLEFKSRISLVRARDVSNDEFLVFIPADTFEHSVTFKYERWLRFTENYFSIVSAFTRTQDQVDINADFAPPPDGYHLLHLSMGTTLDFSFERFKLVIGLDIRNLLDTRYRNYLSRLRYFADEPGRAFILRMKVPF